MAGKNRHWHDAWKRLEDGRLQHDTGAIFIVRGDQAGMRVDQDAASLPDFQADQAARGVATHDMAVRLQRLAREALFWAQDPRNGPPTTRTTG